MDRLGLFILGTVVGVVGTGVAAWLYSEYEAESLENRRNELKREALREQRAEMNATFTADEQAASGETGATEQAVSGEACAEATA